MVMVKKSKKTIYVLINDELVSKALGIIFSDNDIDAEFYKEKDVLLEKMKAKKPDLAIVDYLSNNDEQKKIFTQLKLEFPAVPIVLIITKTIQYDVSFFSGDIRPNAIIMRPFRAIELLDKVTKILYSGKLENYPFPMLIQSLYDGRVTGILHITVEGIKYYIYIIDVVIVYAEYGLRKDTLGMLLLRQGKITQEQYDKALTDASEYHSRLGISLIKLGYLTPAKLNDALKSQVYEKLLHCFMGETGTFSFKFNNRFIDDIIIYKMIPQKIILEGVKKNFSYNRLQPFLKNIRTKKLKVHKKLYANVDLFSFNTEELKIISILKNACIYDEIALRPRVDKKLLAQLLFVLSVTKFLVVAERRELFIDEEAEQKEKTPAESKTKTPQAETAPRAKRDSDAELIYETYINIKAVDYYTLLGVGRDDDMETIKSAYIKLVKKFHPDRFSNIGNPELLQKSNEIFSKVTNAFRTLTDNSKKIQYDYKLDHPKEAEILSNANEIIKSEVEFLRGEKLLKVREYQKAQDAFEYSMKLNPDEPEYKCYYGWAYFLNQSNDKKKKVRVAKKFINEAMESNPNLESGHYFLAVIARFVGELEKSARHFKKVLQINPSHIDAQRALKLLLVQKRKW